MQSHLAPLIRQALSEICEKSFSPERFLSRVPEHYQNLLGDINFRRTVKRSTNEG
jgi:hypothetical protein